MSDTLQRVVELPYVHLLSGTRSLSVLQLNNKLKRIGHLLTPSTD